MAIATGSETYISLEQYPIYYINGLGLSNDATTPNTKLTVGTGVCIDSTNTFQMINNSALTLDATTVGVNGLDTGALAASKVYAVFLISNPFVDGSVRCLLSLSYTAPTMPFGYSAFSRIGYVTTDASAHFLKGYWTASNSASRLFMYDAPQATAITAGHATVATNINLITLVPNFNNIQTWLYTSYTPATAGNALSLTPGNATGIAAKVTGQVATVAVTSNTLVLAQSVAISSVSSPVVNYLVTNASDTAVVNVAGYQFTL